MGETWDWSKASELLVVFFGCLVIVGLVVFADYRSDQIGADGTCSVFQVEAGTCEQNGVDK